MALTSTPQKAPLAQRTQPARGLRWVTLSLLLALAAAAGQSPTEEYRLFQAANPYQFDVVGWMASSLLHQVFAPTPPRPYDGQSLERFLDLARQLGTAKAALAGAVAEGDHRAASYQQEVASIEEELSRLSPQVQEVLREAVASQMRRLGLGNSFFGTRPFPPVNFRLAELPGVLIVSPRTQIRYAGAVLLEPGLSVEQMEEVEARAEALGYSALVVPIGGLGTYPAMVPYSSNLKFLLTTVAHEWVHQYLALRPLGFRYSLGLERDPDVIAINETVADMVGQEVGEATYRELRPQEATAALPPQRPEASQPNAFDFNAEMRKVRLTVDRLLAEGKVQEAEQFMEQARERFVAHGYPIRKLNQAYFAFYGSYADAPYSVNPIGRELRDLRSRYNSLADFLTAVSSFRSRDDLKAALAARR